MELSHFDLNLLRALDALLTECNVTRAGERLCVTQQAMSGSLHRLREHFGDELLVRVGRNLELTPRGAALVGPVREALLGIASALRAEPSFDPATTRRSFRLAMSDYAYAVLLPPLLEHLSKVAPMVTCGVVPIGHGSFLQLERGDVDFCVTPSDWALVTDIEPAPEIRHEQLFIDDFVCVLDGSNVRVEGDLSLEDYVGLAHITTELGTGTESMVEKAWRAAGVRPHVAASAPSIAALLFMIPNTPVICTTPRRLADLLASPLGLDTHPCPLPIPRLEQNLSWHARHADDPGHAYVRGLLRGIGDDLPLSRRGPAGPAA